jgi:hypothetical protein
MNNNLIAFINDLPLAKNTVNAYRFSALRLLKDYYDEEDFKNYASVIPFIQGKYTKSIQKTLFSVLLKYSELPEYRTQLELVNKELKNKHAERPVFDIDNDKLKED